ncbi:phosphatidate cytidylyltransferase [Paracoccus xiamenensis]|uniref:phosphatidate cytidylyltransferase n=1 Tax=Paracoccus xiamenensis TaxID=2714901 RepID=UPI00140A79A5|nr:phosphatidate cytidylyltransferase [Paracoccus xiamenensis]NHF72222.1 phosphatidate cytidylyltransferase [Paracoccus xiamenensis]
MTGGSQKPGPSAAGGNWADLRTRLVSGVILALLGLGLLLSSGLVLRAGLSVLVGLMMWELARLTGPLDQPERNARHALLTGISAGVAAAVVAMLGMPAGASDMTGQLLPYLLLLLVPLAIGWLGAATRNRWPFLLFALAIFGASLGILLTREGFGVGAVLWVAGIVVVSDIMGYFAGRSFGGPKFWPAISPKKTWSGTIAGWVGAVAFTVLILLLTGQSNWQLALMAPVVAFAGQMGDIAESWLKRRVGVKDSSDLIPGHGGVMDRFDAMTGAFLLMPLALLVVICIFLTSPPAAGG